MSKMYLKYLEKKKDNNKYYLFKNGAFYMFLDFYLIIIDY